MIRPWQSHCYIFMAKQTEHDIYSLLVRTWWSSYTLMVRSWSDIQMVIDRMSCHILQTAFSGANPWVFVGVLQIVFTICVSPWRDVLFPLAYTPLDELSPSSYTITWWSRPGVAVTGHWPWAIGLGELLSIELTILSRMQWKPDSWMNQLNILNGQMTKLNCCPL